MRKSGPQILQSAEHALRLVQLITARGSMSLTEVSVELGVGPSTAHRLLATCGHVGFVRQDRPGGRYLVGPAIHELALATTAAVSLRDAASPILQELCTALGETVSVMILEGSHVRFVDSLEGQRYSVRVTTRVGKTMPAHCTSGGKAMLACLPEDELERRYPGHVLARPNERCIPQWPELLKELNRIRRRGWATNFGEGDPGVGGVGVAIRSGTGEPRAAIAVGAPLSRVGTGPEAAAIAPAVTEAAARIQRRLRGAR